MFQLHNIDIVDRIGSTQDQVKYIFQQGGKEGRGVLSKYQSSGRGRYDREWIGGSGNFLFSVLLTPDCPVSRVSELSFVAAIAAHDSVVEALGCYIDGMRIKWPNDLMIGAEKLAGLLLEIEHSDDGFGVVLGVGVNLSRAPEGGISLSGVQQDFDIGPVSFAEMFMKNLAKVYDQWQEYGFDTIRKEWLSRAKCVGENVIVKLRDESFSGTVLDLDPSGALIVDVEDGSGQRKVTAGDVFFPV